MFTDLFSARRFKYPIKNILKRLWTLRKLSRNAGVIEKIMICTNW